MVRGLVQADNPFRLVLTTFAQARAMRLPLVDARWGKGTREPSPEDVAKAIQWLNAERVEADLLDQLQSRYRSFAERGVLTMTEPERRRELIRLDEVVLAAEFLKKPRISSAP